MQKPKNTKHTQPEETQKEEGAKGFTNKGGRYKLKGKRTYLWFLKPQDKAFKNKDL